MRGNPLLGRREVECPGSIPAYAGEPVCCRLAPAPVGVYPRVCGGTAFRVGDSLAFAGLSPRMRGNPRQPPAARGRPGSIPAYAGEPTRQASGCPMMRVYPRVCGGTPNYDTVALADTGLSPRMRGNLLQPPLQLHNAGSIPAYAGEPQATASTRTARRVYPRVCGGTPHRTRAIMPPSGLSPRMRGNPGSSGRGKASPRSIPAYAGEPAW